MNPVILIFFLIVNVLATLTATTWCACADYTKQSECSTLYNCFWGASGCEEKACSTASLDECNIMWYCLVNSKGECQDYGECADFTVTDPIYCMLSVGNCASSTTSKNGVFQCQTYIPSPCSALTVDNCKNSYSGEDLICWPNGSTCQEYNMATCVGLPEDLCVKLGCDWTEQKCQTMKCNSLAEEDCSIAYDSYLGNEILCKWDTIAKTCIERQDVLDLTADNCAITTDQAFYWSEGGTCEQCGSTFLYLFSTKLAILVITLIFVE